MPTASSITAAALPVYRIEIAPAADAPSARLLDALRDAGLRGARSAFETRLFFLEGALAKAEVDCLAAELLADPVTERAAVAVRDDEIEPTVGAHALEVHLRPGVMDPVALSTLGELRAAGYDVDGVRTARRYIVAGEFDARQLETAARRVLANEGIEELILGSAGVKPGPRAPIFEFRLRHVALRALDDTALAHLSRTGHLFLSLDEMRAIQAHYSGINRDPTDLELETLAQTWSEHCGHKTFKSAVIYRGAPFPSRSTSESSIEVRYSNLLKDTIAAATAEIRDRGGGPECLSVFVDNAGVIGFDDQYGVAFKVETHNRPSAIEPYGGAATGIGGCIRDVLGCGLGAKPIANTDVFCVAPGDWPQDALPRGVLHPARVLRGVVRGVADYGNRMGIPTVNGAVLFDPRYLGNPLVYCGCVGLIPRDKIDKQAQPGDAVVVIGGRTGRDGIHGATFSSAELTDKHADEFSSAVQIGNAITEKRVLDALLRARDHATGCLYSAITDCGAGGLSSAIGEMAAEIGATVDLEHVPLKYDGLRYDEIWISEAQERMVLAVPPVRLAALLAVMAEEEVEATVIGAFGLATANGAPQLRIRYDASVVGELDMHFLHAGLPKRHMVAEWQPAPELSPRFAIAPPRSGGSGRSAAAYWDELRSRLATPATASKEWIIRSYDHEVQGGSAVKPLGGPGKGPNDAAVLLPRLDSRRGIAIGCGLAPHLSDIDPYWMACNAIDEAIRNVVCVGGDPSQAAILDNFCWGRCDDPRTMGALVRACQACHDVALAYGTPFISGKDSLNNEYLLHDDDVEAVLATLRDLAARDVAKSEWTSALPVIEERVRRTHRLAIPHTLLISAVSIVPDVTNCITADIKPYGANEARPSTLVLVGGLPTTGFALESASQIHRKIATLIGSGMIRACHDVAGGGWLVAIAEMALAGLRGVTLHDTAAVDTDPFAELAAAYVLETSDSEAVTRTLADCAVAARVIGVTRPDDQFVIQHDGQTVGGSVRELNAIWRGKSGGQG